MSGSVSITGKISFVKLNPTVATGDDFCLIGLLPTDGSPQEIFAVWWGQNLLPQLPPSAAEWILRCVQVAMLREAMSKQLDVTITHDPALNTFTVVEVNSP